MSNTREQRIKQNQVLELAREAYITGDETLEEVRARFPTLPKTTLVNRSQREGWVHMRHNFKTRLLKKEVSSKADCLAMKRIAFLGDADRIAGKLRGLIEKQADKLTDMIEQVQRPEELSAIIQDTNRIGKTYEVWNNASRNNLGLNDVKTVDAGDHMKSVIDVEPMPACKEISEKTED